MDRLKKYRFVAKLWVSVHKHWFCNIFSALIKLQWFSGALCIKFTTSHNNHCNHLIWETERETVMISPCLWAELILGLILFSNSYSLLSSFQYFWSMDDRLKIRFLLSDFKFSHHFVLLIVIPPPLLCEPLALPEVNRLGLCGTVSPRETPSSPSCHTIFFLPLLLTHTHSHTHRPRTHTFNTYTCDLHRHII